MKELQEVAERAQDYHDSVLLVKEYLADNGIDEQAKIFYFLLMGIVWTAMKRNEKVTDDDANIWLGLEPNTVTGMDGVDRLPEMADIPLDKFLEYLKTTFTS
jgi:hypothetical protein